MATASVPLNVRLRAAAKRREMRCRQQQSPGDCDGIGEGRHGKFGCPGKKKNDAEACKRSRAPFDLRPGTEQRHPGDRRRKQGENPMHPFQSDKCCDREKAGDDRTRQAMGEACDRETGAPAIIGAAGQ